MYIDGMKNTLTVEEAAAIQRFATNEGRRWKSILLDQWMRACSGLMDDPDQSILQHIRNAYGPSWLASYRLPKGWKPVGPLSGQIGGR
jgi:hypothetical protein